NLSYGYDADGDLTSRATPDGATATYHYNADHQPDSLTIDNATINYNYDADSRLTTSDLPNGVTETRAYDPASRLTSIKDTASGTTISNYAYSYDAADNPTTITVNGEADTYTYNVRNQLTGVCYATSCTDGSITWTYDADGDRLTESR